MEDQEEDPTAVEPGDLEGGEIGVAGAHPEENGGTGVEPEAEEPEEDQEPPEGYEPQVEMAPDQTSGILERMVDDSDELEDLMDDDEAEADDGDDEVEDGDLPDVEEDD